MYLLCFLVPETHLEMVKNAVFATGAGTLSNYAQCAWQTLGEGQFMPLTGSNAFLGEIDIVERVAEYKVEVVCEEQQIQAAVMALKQAHPYETPAFHVLKCENI